MGEGEELATSTIKSGALWVLGAAANRSTCRNIPAMADISLAIKLGLPQSAGHESVGKRQQRHTNDAYDDEFEVLFDRRNISECIAGAHADSDPGKSRDKIEQGELRVRHRPASGDERHERANDGHELSQHNSLAAVMFEERVRLHQMLPIHQPV